MEHLAGIDVSLNLSSVCVVDANRKVLLVLSFWLDPKRSCRAKKIIAIACLLGLL